MNSTKMSTKTTVSGNRRMAQIERDRQRVAEGILNHNVVKVPISQIVVPEEKVNNLEKEDIDTMTESVSRHGLMSVVTGCGPYPDGTYRLIDGARRLEALVRIYGSKKGAIPIYVIAGAVSDDEVRRLTAAGIVPRKNDHRIALQYADAAIEDAENGLIAPHRKAYMMSQDTGLCQRQCRNYLCIASEETAPEVRKAVEEKKLPIVVGCLISRNCQITTSAMKGDEEVSSSIPDYETQCALTHKYQQIRRKEKETMRRDLAAGLGRELLVEEETEVTARQVSRMIEHASKSLRDVFALSDEELKKVDPALLNELADVCFKFCRRLATVE